MDPSDVGWRLARDGTIEPTGVRGIFPHLDGSGRRALPVWSRGGPVVVFRLGDAILVAPVEREGGVRVGEAVEIFSSNRIYRDDCGNATFGAAPHGRLLISLRDRENVRPRVILNWKPGIDASF